MEGFRDGDKQRFPLQDISSVVDLFKNQLETTDQPNLALLSIIVGAIENVLTVNRALPQAVDPNKTLEPIFPVLDLPTVEGLYCKFESLIKGSVDLTQYPTDFASRELVKRISDVIWGSLTRSYYKDKAHLQSLYSFLTGNKLDCFGVAYAVVAGAQILGFHDVHLSLSEDHAWVVFGEGGNQTAEVTWHGKGNEDKRGRPISESVYSQSWLYLNGYPVVCDRFMEVASLVSSINPAINATTDSVEMGDLQQELLWLLYDKGHLKKYPMAIGNLGDLEEIQPSPGRQTEEELYAEAIETVCRLYNNQHVYPYTYMAGFLYRKKRYKEALKFWAEAANVIKKYNYNRQDEEIYKEFLEIANEMIPHIVKTVSGDVHHTNGNPANNDVNLLSDVDCYQYLLTFYDGICQWEEGSSTPVLHVGWAQHWVFSLSKFDRRVREGLDIHAEGEEDESGSEEENGEQVDDSRQKRKRKTKGDSAIQNGSNENEVKVKVNGKSEEEQIKSTIEELASKVGEEGQNETPNPNIAALAQACGESILNPDYLLGSGEPFSSSANTATTNDTKVEVTEFLSSKCNNSPFQGMTMDSMLKAESPADMMLFKSMLRPGSSRSVRENETPVIDSLSEENENSSPVLVLHSQKMKGLKTLLMASKLNGSAIKLQLTAQSQVHVKHGRRGADDIGGRPKRSRRE